MIMKNVAIMVDSVHVSIECVRLLSRRGSLRHFQRMRITTFSWLILILTRIFPSQVDILISTKEKKTQILRGSQLQADAWQVVLHWLFLCPGIAGAN